MGEAEGETAGVDVGAADGCVDEGRLDGFALRVSRGAGSEGVDEVSASVGWDDRVNVGSASVGVAAGVLAAMRGTTGLGEASTGRWACQAWAPVAVAARARIAVVIHGHR